MSDPSFVQLDVEGGRANVWKEIAELKRELASVKLDRDGQRPHPPEWWIERRNQMLRLIEERHGVVDIDDVYGDLWFQRDGCFSTPIQYGRAIRRFSRNAYRAEGDVSILFSFLVPGKGTGRWYIGHLNEAHCAIDEGVRRMHFKDAMTAGQIARRLKERYDAQAPCERCKKDAEKVAQ